jgi:hypothetical protein
MGVQQRQCFCASENLTAWVGIVEKCMRISFSSKCCDTKRLTKPKERPKAHLCRSLLPGKAHCIDRFMDIPQCVSLKMAIATPFMVSLCYYRKSYNE